MINKIKLRLPLYLYIGLGLVFSFAISGCGDSFEREIQGRRSNPCQGNESRA